MMDKCRTCGRQEDKDSPNHCEPVKSSDGHVQMICKFCRDLGGVVEDENGDLRWEDEI